MSISRTLQVTVVFLPALLFATTGWVQEDTETDAVSGASPENEPIDNSTDSKIEQKKDTNRATDTAVTKMIIDLPVSYWRSDRNRRAISGSH